MWVFKILRLLRWFQICGNNWKKIQPENVLCQVLLQVSSIEEEKLRFFTPFLAITFLLANFHIFLNSFEISTKFCVVLILIFKFCKEKVFISYKHFFETLKPDSQETAKNFEKRVLQQCLRITFDAYKTVNPFHFLN
jgi:hypothetical protein